MIDTHEAAGSGEAPKHTNRLAHESSPYLLQHAHNPVDWYPWGEAAFAKAREEDKPILLSVGYASCHWCHVMAHESFEDEDTARLMNEYFVSVKVDREERPDVDALYMDAVQALTGAGGWPMTVFLTPDGAPFYGGTYFPPRDRYGMPGFPTLLQSIAHLYQTRREDVEKQAAEFRDFYQRRGAQQLQLPEGLTPAQTPVDPGVLTNAMDRLLAQVDAVEGGFGRAPKFPHAMAIDFLLRLQSRAGSPPPAGAITLAPDPRLLPLVELTLDKMAGGGIYDQVGGGFHRYSTDAQWLVPHFEKMLYDNALLSLAYLHAWQVTGNERYQRICEETLNYVLREMTDRAGGFYSTQDADSEGEEGKFYVLTSDEIRAVLGADDATAIEMLWGISAVGNFEGKNVPHLARAEKDVAAALGIGEPELRSLVASARQRLYDARAKRIAPGKDDKVLAAWNGLMLRSFSEAARVLGRADYRGAALANASFLLEHMMVEGTLRRSWRQGQARLDAYLEDYAAVLNGLLTTYELTGEERYFVEARRLADEMLARFWDDDAQTFYDTAHDHETLIGRPRELTDGATPSGISLASEGLLRLAALTGEERYRDRAARMLVPLAPAMAQSPSSFSHLLCALDDFIGLFFEIALVGAAAQREAFARVLCREFLPRAAIAQGDGESPSAVPLLADRAPIHGAAAAYVCQGFVCRQPVTMAEALRAQLHGAP